MKTLAIRTTVVPIRILSRTTVVPINIDYYMSLVMRKPAFCKCENKDADQLCGNRTADQRLCFRYIDSTIPLLPKSKFQASSHIQCLCQTWSETPKTSFLTTRLICQFSYHTQYQPETPISARDSRISPRAEGPRADTGRPEG